jgi:hypothetical protein
LETKNSTAEIHWLTSAFFLTRPSENEAVTSGKVVLSSHKTMASERAKPAVPKTITGEVRWHIDCGTACGTGF